MKKKAKKKSNFFNNFVSILIIVVLVGIAFLLFYFSNSSRIANQNENYISDITTQRANLLHNLFAESMRYIESSAMVLETEFSKRYFDFSTLDNPDVDSIDEESLKTINEVLSNYENRFAFNYLRFIDMQGRYYVASDTNIHGIVTNREYYKQGSQGKTGMTYIFGSTLTNERQIGFYSPIYHESQIVGIAVGLYDESFIQEILSMTMFDYDCEVLLCDKDGTVIWNTFGNDKFDNFITFVNNNNTISNEEKEHIYNTFHDKKEVSYHFVENGQNSVGCISYIGEYSDFFVIMNFPPTAYHEMLNRSNLNGVALLIILVIIFSTFGLIYAIKYIYQRKKIMEEAKNSNDIHAAMSLLFENFIIVDVDSKKYNYIEGMPEVGEIPKVGNYNTFVNSLLSRFPIVGEKEEAEKALSFDNLILQMNQGKNILSYNLHAPIYEEEWFTYNFIVVARENNKVKEFIIARQDITNLQKKEETLRNVLKEARDAAEKGNRAKTDFLSNMSHDIRTPMNAIVGYTNIARESINDKEVVKESLNRISSSSKYLLSLINDILDMSKIESGNLQFNYTNEDLVVLFKRIEDITRSQSHAKKVNVYFDISKITHNLIKIDELRFDQIMINIIGNAIKYTPEGKNIYVTVTEKTEDFDGKIAKFIFTVRDEGIGISKEFLPHIFESFAREKNSRIDKIQGTGLGLAITARLVEIMHGKIHVDSEVGVGTEFTVLLSFEVHDTKVEYDDIKSIDINDVNLNGIKALLVEDNDINAEIATVILAQYGVEVERACDGKECIDIITQKEIGYYDVVLMDIQMPVMNGYETTSIIRSFDDRYYKNIPIIAMSANAYEEDVRESLDSGMNDHIAKPFEPKKLALIIYEYTKKS